MNGRALIADGHHRYETLLRLGPELRALDYAAGGAAADFAMMFLARAEDPGLLVLPTHRLIRDLPDFDFAALCAGAGAAFDIVEGDEATAPAIEERLGREGTAGVVFAARGPGRAGTTWFTLKSFVDLSALGPPALRKLDVTVLHGVILAPLLGIDAAALESQSTRLLPCAPSPRRALGAASRRSSLSRTSKRSCRSRSARIWS